MGRLELPTSCTRSTRSTRLSYTLVRDAGIEPACTDTPSRRPTLSLIPDVSVFQGGELTTLSNHNLEPYPRETAGRLVESQVGGLVGGVGIEPT